MDETNDVFKDLIGLDNTKRKLNFYLKNYQNTYISPNLLLYSAKGCGKTSLARKYASALTTKSDKTKIKKYIEINSSTIDDIDSFFGIVNNHLVDQDCTVFFDEAETIEDDLSLTLCSILNPNKDNINYFNYNGNNYVFDFSRLTFIFASTEIQKIHHALLDRLNIIDFDDYKISDLAKIIQKNLSDYKIEDGLLDMVATVVRGNPRQAQKLSNDIIAYLKSKSNKQFTKNDWINIRYQLNINDYGLTASEIKVLQILKDNPNGVSLTKVSSILGSTAENCRKFIELYPLKLGLFEVRPAIGRVLTAKGYEIANKL